MKAARTCRIIAVLAGVINARHLIPSIPKPTHTFQLSDDGVSPLPTGGAMELFRRIDTFDTITAWAPDRTCGFGDRGLIDPCECDPSSTCAVISSATGGIVACCQGSSCDHYNSCIDFKDYWSPNGCDDNCKTNKNVLKCTASTASHCNIVSFPANITGYYCDFRKIADSHFNFTYSGGEERHFTTAAITTSDSSYTTTVIVSAYVTYSNTSNDGGQDNDSKKLSNTGSIAGGGVGGVVGLVLIGAGIFFLWKKKKERAATNAAGTAISETPPYEQQSGSSPDKYLLVPQANTNDNHPTSPYYQYNTNTGFYEAKKELLSEAPGDNTMPAHEAPGDDKIPIHEAPSDNTSQIGIQEALVTNRTQDKAYELP
ncbi:hypothetical protein BGZ63DRAFT_404960 [Mariannaea sp. PMI_226]|nr:hypothetical protein BGZ63DRAFT_404960 [Mariannaea sp. PMI_226]